MSYTAKATSANPGRIVFLIDVSGSMGDPLATGELKIDVVNQAVKSAVADLGGSSMKALDKVSGRYLLAMFSYSQNVTNLLHGFMPISDADARKTPKMQPGGKTNTSKAFQEVRDLLKAELANIKPGDPAPLVCHLTDGEWTDGGDPVSIAQEIKDMQVDDGNFLVLNIFISDQVLQQPLPDELREWKGITSTEDLLPGYGHTLFEMSSLLPETFRQRMLDEEGFEMQSGAKMLFPGAQPEIIYLGLTAATKTGAGGIIE